MGAAWGQYLIDAILREGSLRIARERGITPEMLAGPARAALQYLYDYAARPATADQVPPRHLLQQAIPVLEWPPESSDAPTDMRVLCDLTLAEFAQGQISVISAELMETSGTDPFAAIQQAITKLMALNGVAAQSTLKTVDLEGDLFGLVQRYHAQLYQNGGMAGLPYPWPGLNRITLGMQPGEFVFVYGIPKSMKTWIVMAILANLMYNNLGRVLVYTPEVFVQEFAVRMSCLLTGVDYTKVLRCWNFSDDPQEQAEAANFYAVLHALSLRAASPERMQPFTLLHGEINMRGGDPLAFLTPSIELYEPHVVFVDSAYLLTEDIDSKYVAKLGRSAKLLGERTGTTVVLTSQENAIKAYDAANRGRALGASGASWGQGFVQNTDLAIQVVKQPYNNGFRLSLNLTGRKAKEPGIVISGNPGHDMREVPDRKPFNLADVLDAQRKAATAAASQSSGGSRDEPRVANTLGRLNSMAAYRQGGS